MPSLSFWLLPRISYLLTESSCPGLLSAPCRLVIRSWSWFPSAWAALSPDSPRAAFSALRLTCRGHLFPEALPKLGLWTCRPSHSRPATPPCSLSFSSVVSDSLLLLAALLIICLSPVEGYLPHSKLHLVLGCALGVWHIIGFQEWCLVNDL